MIGYVAPYPELPRLTGVNDARWAKHLQKRFRATSAGRLQQRSLQDVTSPAPIMAKTELSILAGQAKLPWRSKCGPAARVAEFERRLQQPWPSGQRPPSRKSTSLPGMRQIYEGVHRNAKGQTLPTPISARSSIIAAQAVQEATSGAISAPSSADVSPGGELSPPLSPDSQEQPAPQCPGHKHPMVFRVGTYNAYECNLCGKSSSGHRWHCAEHKADLCHDCATDPGSHRHRRMQLPICDTSGARAKVAWSVDCAETAHPMSPPRLPLPVPARRNVARSSSAADADDAAKKRLQAVKLEEEDKQRVEEEERKRTERRQEDGKRQEAERHRLQKRTDRERRWEEAAAKATQDKTLQWGEDLEVDVETVEIDVLEVQPEEGAGEDDGTEYAATEAAMTEGAATDYTGVSGTEYAGTQAAHSDSSDGASEELNHAIEESSGDEGERIREPLDVELPPWFPADVPLPCASSTGSLPGSRKSSGASQPQAPSVMPLGHRKLLVTWEVPPEMRAGLMWHLRLRPAGAGEEAWRRVDLESGRVAAADEALSWKHKAFIVQQGLRVLSHFVTEGQKSEQPTPGTIAAHHPGIVTVDFEGRHGGVVERQRIPQDWVILASTVKEMKDVVWSLLDKQHPLQEGPSGKRLWKLAKHKVYERIVRRFRQSAVIWSQRLMPPSPGSRVACMCTLGQAEGLNLREPAMGLPRQGSRRVSEESDVPFRCGPDSTSWWPAVVPPEALEEFTQASKDWPDELVDRSDLEVTLEPYPRIQVLPRAFICDALMDSQRASRNICPGQKLLMYYALGSGPAAEAATSPHPPERQPGDCTLLAGGANLVCFDSEDFASNVAEGSFSQNLVPPVRSERAVRCVVLRELIAPAKAYVYVKAGGHRSLMKVPLNTVYTVSEPQPKGTGRKRKPRERVHEWVFVKKEDGDVQVKALVGPARGQWTCQIDLVPNLKVRFFEVIAGSRRLCSGVIQKISARPSHMEVQFEPVVPQVATISAYSLGLELSPGPPRRTKQPAIVLQELPEKFTKVEVSVGVSDDSSNGVPLWSPPCVPCQLRSSATPSGPLPPAVIPAGVSRAEVKWLLPPETPALCFQLRFREAGKKDWNFIDSAGRARELESTLSWRCQLMPLTEGIWASAFGLFDGLRAATPGPGRLEKVDVHRDVAFIAFEKPSKELSLGTSDASADGPKLVCTRSSHALKNGDVQSIPLSWIEAVWVSDGHHFYKGAPVLSGKSMQNVRFSPAQGGYAVFLEGEEEKLPGIMVEERWLHHAGAVSSGNGSMRLSMQMGCQEILGLRAEVSYEVGVQVLTKDGWTEWSPTTFLEMPRIGYEQEKLVLERRDNVFYRSSMLPQAFFKEYDRCWESVEEALTPDRLEKLKVVIGRRERAEEQFDLDKSRWLVDIQGPIRESYRVPESEARWRIRELVQQRANVNFRDQATGRTPLTCACEYGSRVRLCVVEELLVLRADVDSMNDSRRTALAIAAAGGHIALVELLLSHGADATIVSLKGETALLGAVLAQGMSTKEIRGVEAARELLTKDRVPWQDFAAAVSHAADPRAAAQAFLQLIFPGGAGTMFVEEKERKRISKHDRLRLREQILEVGERDPDEAAARGRFCAFSLLLPQMRAAALQEPPNSECAPFSRYLLMSGVMRWCHHEAHQEAQSLLAHFEQQLSLKRAKLKELPKLTTEAESFVNMASRSKQRKFNGRVLHQWHAHNDLLWLTEQNVVNAFEALIKTSAVMDMEDFCTWVGELNAHICAVEAFERPVTLGAWDKRLPLLFWGSAYVKFLVGEAQRAAPVFHRIVEKLVKEVGGDVCYKEAPNKTMGRILAKQTDYASPSLLLLHFAQDLMPGRFSKVLRADLPGRSFQDVSDTNGTQKQKGAFLILGTVAPEERLHMTMEAARAVSQSRTPGQEGAESPVLVVLLPPQGGQSALTSEELEAVETRLRSCGADAVVSCPPGGFSEPEKAKELLLEGLLAATESFRVRTGVLALDNGLEAEEDEAEEMSPGRPFAFASTSSPSSRRVPSAEKAQLLFEMRKCKTGAVDDLLCAGGLLDLVRGSITCSSEDELLRTYEKALSLTVENDRAEVVRVKNGFHTPAVGGYCDLKLFLLIATDRRKDVGVGSKVCHICELQVHLKEFLECKKFTHMPYVIDRGDFDA